MMSLVDTYPFRRVDPYLLMGWIHSIKGYGSNQNVIDGPQCPANFGEIKKMTTKGGFKSEGRSGFSQLPKMSTEKTILGFRK